MILCKELPPDNPSRSLGIFDIFAELNAISSYLQVFCNFHKTFVYRFAIEE